MILWSLCAVPATAQGDEGSSVIDQALRQLLDGLIQEMEPTLDDMSDFLAQMGPALADLMDEVKDWSAYEAPEMLDNGDIIIRRKPDADDPPASPGREPLPQIEL